MKRATVSSPSSAFILPVSLVLLALLGCSESGESNNSDTGAPNNCAPGLKPMGPACVPIFDECKDDEVPMLGGGCKRVGVKECLDGWGLMGPPDWKCKPIGPPRTCLKGWEKVAGGWCEPILPKTKCPVGTMEKIGYSTCQPIGDCGTGTWGNIKTTDSTIYVDQGHSGTGGKGTNAEPFKTIGEALNQATSGDHIAVAAGTYKENIEVVRKVTLEGRCAQKVTIVGASLSFTVEMKSWSNGAVIRGVTITGFGAGLRVIGVGAKVELVAVRGCEGRGVQVDSGGTLTLRDSLIAGNRDAGVLLFSSKATLERTEIPDTRGRASDNQFGRGIHAQLQSSQSPPSELTLRDSLVAGNREAGIYLYSSKATLERTVVQNTHEDPADNESGAGIVAQVQFGQTQPSELTLRDCIVAGNQYVGVSLLSSMATVERTVVRNTREQAMNKTGGGGIAAQVLPNLSRPSVLTIRDSLVLRNRDIGIALWASKATVEQTVIQDTREQASNNKGGMGIYAQVGTGQTSPSELTIRDSLVAGNRSTGILLASSKVTVERTVVRDTRERASDNRFGEGIQAQVQSGQSQFPELTVRDSLIVRNRDIGIVLFAAKASIERTVVRDTYEQAMDMQFGTGIQATDLTPLGQSQPSELTVRDSLVAGNRNVGIALGGSIGKIVRCAISNTRKDGHAKYGDGVAVSKKSTLVVENTLVERSARAGFLFTDSGGSIQRCRIRRNVFAIDLENGAAPFISDDNQMVDNQINHVTIGRGLKAAPMPSIPNL